MLEFTVAINEKFIDKIPAGAEHLWREFNGSFQNKTLALWPFVNYIRQGHAFTQVHSGYRKADQHFVSGQVLALDMDNGKSSIEYLSQEPFVRKFASLIYTTPSHTPEEPRSRVVFILSSPVYNPSAFTSLAEGLLFKFGDLEPDRVCKDPLRLFFGSKGCQFKIFPENVLPLGYAVTQLANPYEKYKQEKQAKLMQNARKVSVDNIESEPLIQELVNKISCAVDGEKHSVLNRCAYVAGGYVAAGLISFGEAEQRLYDAISSVGTVKSLSLAHRTIAQGLRDGSKFPFVPVVNETKALAMAKNPFLQLGIA